MPSKLRKKTLVYVLEWDAVIHRGEYICSEFLSFVSRFGYCRCRPRYLFQVLVFLFKHLQKTRMRSKRRQPHLKVTTSLCKRVCFATNNFCAWHWKYSTQTEEALLIFSEVLKFDLRKKFLWTQGCTFVLRQILHNRKLSATENEMCTWLKLN